MSSYIGQLAQQVQRLRDEAALAARLAANADHAAARGRDRLTLPKGTNAMSHSKPLLPISPSDFEALVADTQLTPSVVAFALLDVNGVRASSRSAVLRARLAQLDPHNERRA